MQLVQHQDTTGLSGYAGLLPSNSGKDLTVTRGYYHSLFLILEGDPMNSVFIMRVYLHITES